MPVYVTIVGVTERVNLLGLCVSLFPLIGCKFVYTCMLFGVRMESRMYYIDMHSYLYPGLLVSDTRPNIRYSGGYFRLRIGPTCMDTQIGNLHYIPSTTTSCLPGSILQNTIFAITLPKPHIQRFNGGVTLLPLYIQGPNYPELGTAAFARSNSIY